jgi:thiol-disulfide isomerase/thioredoxin
MKTIITGLLLCLFTIAGKTQNPSQPSIGEKMSNITFKHFYQQPGKKVSLQQLSGKWVILDFWETHCGSCLAAFPKMEALQKRFGDSIYILLVASNSASQLEKLFKKVPQPALPIIVGDTILSAMFPHYSVPHHVWIDPKGIVRYITFGEEATSENIGKVLKSESLSLRLRLEWTDFNKEAPLLEEGGGRMKKYILGYSVMMGPMSEVQIGGITIKIDSLDNFSGFKILNLPLLDMYKMAWGGGDFIKGTSTFQENNRVCFLVQDSLLLNRLNDLVSYESNCQPGTERESYDRFQQDLIKYFHFDVKVETKNMEYYALVSKDSSNSWIYHGGDSDLTYTDSVFSMKNFSLSNLVEAINRDKNTGDIPVIDECIQGKNADIMLHNAFLNLETLQQELSKNGLKLEKRTGNLDMLVIRQRADKK